MRNAVVLLLLVIGFVFSGFFVVDQQQVVIKDTTPLQLFEPGIHWSLPFSATLQPVATNLRTSCLPLSITVPQHQKIALKVLIQWQVVKPLKYLNYLNSPPQNRDSQARNPQYQDSQGRNPQYQESLQKFAPKLAELVESQLNAVAAAGMPSLLAQLHATDYAELGIRILKISFISIAVAESAAQATTNLTAAPLSLESSFNLAQQLKNTTEKLKHNELAQLRRQDPRFFDYFMKIEDYRTTAKTHQDVPPFKQLYPWGN